MQESNESQNAPDGDLSAEFNDTSWVSCPHCGEASELLVDLSGGSIQEYVQDCQVCCYPWVVRVELDVDGYPSVSVAKLDDE